jgi:hypothetical protein
VGTRIGTTAIGVALAASLSLAPVHNAAAAVPAGAYAAGSGGALGVYAFAKKKKKKKKPAAEVDEDPSPKITPEAADTKRQAIRASVQSARDAGDWEKVAEGLEKNAPLIGDPVTMLEAGEARVEAAAKQRSVEQAEIAIEDTRVALDILHFYDAVASGQATSSWHVIAPGDAATLIAQGDSQVERAEALISEIEAEKVAAAGSKGDDKADKKKKKKEKKPRDGKAKPGTGMIAGGSIFLVAGVAGITMVIIGTARAAAAQGEVEKLEPGDDQIDTYDKIGKQSNILAYAGAGVAVAGLAVGLPLLIIGVKRRKAAGSGSAATSARLQRREAFGVAPVFAGGTQGVVLRGRF